MNLGLRAAAEQLGISHAALLKAARTGRVKRNEDGSFDVEACREALKQNTQPAKRAKEARAREQRQSPEPPKRASEPRRPPEPVTDDSAPAAGSLAAIELKRATVKLRKEARLLQKLEGSLLDKNEVEHAWSEVCSSFRSQTLLLPAKLAPRLAPVTDARECQALIDAEVRRLLTTLSDYQPESPNQ
jgi:hypothetical protein